MSRHGSIAMVSLLVLTACVSTPDFENSSLIDRPRVLAIVAEPPEMAPGEGSDLSIMLAGFDGLDYEVTWKACAAFATSVGGNQYGDADRDESCEGEAGIDVGTGMTASLGGGATQALFTNLTFGRAVLGDQVPPELVDKVIEEVGLMVTIEAVVSTDERVWRATKVVLINQASQHDNPPMPHFAVGDTEVVAVPDVAFACEAADGGPVTVEPGQEIELAPLVEGDEEPWLETYKAIDLTGELLELDEQGFYSWYSDAGKLAEVTTRSPLRNNLWDTPREPGCHSLWNVVRDGHGGTSACRVAIAVGGGACD